MQIVTPESAEGRRVLLRLDLDVPMQDDWTVADTTRIDVAQPTLDLIKARATQVIFFGHMGRPNGKVDPTLSVKPLVPYLEERLGDRVAFVSQPIQELTHVTKRYTLLENLRFEAGEEANDPSFAESLAKLGDVFINEAFGVAHRTAASTVGITKLRPSFAGLHFAKEVVELSTILHNPLQPFVVLLGGVKLETKLPVIENLKELADVVLVGGLLAKEMKKKPPANAERIIVADLTDDEKDITEDSIKRFTTILSKAQTIVWNGPVGKFEENDNAVGTKKLAQAIVDSGAYSIVGGGDTLAALHSFGLIDQFDFVSVGGGAMLDFLAGQTLPAVEALR